MGKERKGERNREKKREKREKKRETREKKRERERGGKSEKMAGDVTEGTRVFISLYNDGRRSRGRYKVTVDKYHYRRLQTRQDKTAAKIKYFFFQY